MRSVRLEMSNVQLRRVDLPCDPDSSNVPEFITTELLDFHSDEDMEVAHINGARHVLRLVSSLAHAVRGPCSICPRAWHHGSRLHFISWSGYVAAGDARLLSMLEQLKASA